MYPFMDFHSCIRSWTFSADLANMQSIHVIFLMLMTTRIVSKFLCAMYALVTEVLMCSMNMSVQVFNQSEQLSTYRTLQFA